MGGIFSRARAGHRVVAFVWRLRGMFDDVGFVSIEVKYLDLVLLLYFCLDSVLSLRTLPQLVKLEHSGLTLKVAVVVKIIYHFLCC